MYYRRCTARVKLSLSLDLPIVCQLEEILIHFTAEQYFITNKNRFLLHFWSVALLFSFVYVTLVWIINQDCTTSLCRICGSKNICNLAFARICSLKIYAFCISRYDIETIQHFYFLKPRSKCVGLCKDKQFKPIFTYANIKCIQHIVTGKVDVLYIYI